MQGRGSILVTENMNHGRKNNASELEKPTNAYVTKICLGTVRVDRLWVEALRYILWVWMSSNLIFNGAHALVFCGHVVNILFRNSKTF